MHRLTYRIHPPSLQVAQLETQLAAAERCSAELRELTTQLGSVRQEDVEVLKVRKVLRAGSNPLPNRAGLQPCVRDTIPMSSCFVLNGSYSFF